MCPETEEHFKSSQYVFLGNVSKVREYGINWFRDEPKIKVYFDVQENYKGSWDKNPLKTIDNSYSCKGYFFEENKQYIIYLSFEDEFDLCDAEPTDNKTIQKLNNLSNAK